MSALFLSTLAEDPRFMSRYGEAIRERREVIGFPTATACANASAQLELQDPTAFKRFSQSSLSRWELDRTGELIEAAHSRSLRTLSYLLKWSSEEFEQHVGVPIGRVPMIDEHEWPERGGWTLEFDNGTARRRPIALGGGLALVEVVGAANGGRPSEYAIPVKKNVVRPGSRAFEVQGDSMDLGGGEGIRDGDWVLVDMALSEPANGRVFLLQIIGDGMTVKRLRKLGGEWLFVPDNPNASEEAFRDNDVEIVGQVYAKINYGEVR